MNNKPLITDEEYAQEVKSHFDYLNWVFGASTTFLAIACLQFPTPSRAAILCLGAIIPMYIYAFSSFPVSLKVLRKLYAETKDENVKKIIQHLEKKYHGWNVIFTNFILWFGLALFLFVLASDLFQGPLQWIKT
ncbi:MAG: hypothetical protein ACTS9Y_01665 [Methylophilus sp.]|uniref:hypothetical protein n=1 Tax=Methylophilus sp. TaxID=29541 RepID=UPI003FA05A48